MTTVSFIIPVYNAQATIRRCLDSILSQQYQEVEIVAVNDGSQDSSLEILREYSKAHSNLVVVDTANQGVSLARNKGMEVATGEYLVFVDCDDYIDSDYLTEYMAQRDKDYDIVVGGWRRVDSTGKLMFERRLKGSEWETYINTYPWSKLYRRDFLIGHGIEFLNYGIGEDMYFTCSAKAKAASIKVIGYIGYTWVYNETSVSNTAHKGLKQGLDVLYLLDKINGLFEIKPELLKYYYRRFLVWWLLYSGKQATGADFLAEHSRVMAWIGANGVKSRLTPFSAMLRGERLFERFTVVAFGVLERLHLLRLFAALYCRGTNPATR